MKHPWHLHGKNWSDPAYIEKALEKAMPWIESEFLVSGCDEKPTKIEHITYQPGFLSRLRVHLDRYRDMPPCTLRETTAQRILATVFYWRNYWGLIK